MNVPVALLSITALTWCPWICISTWRLVRFVFIFLRDLIACCSGRPWVPAATSFLSSRAPGKLISCPPPLDRITPSLAHGVRNCYGCSCTKVPRDGVLTHRLPRRPWLRRSSWLVSHGFGTSVSFFLQAGRFRWSCGTACHVLRKGNRVPCACLIRRSSRFRQWSSGWHVPLRSKG